MEIEFAVDNSRLSYETVQFLEHVVLTVTLEVRDYGEQYTVDDFVVFHGRVGNDTERLIEWLSDPHPRRGDIQIKLTSPQNTTSTLLPYRDFDFVNAEGYDDWPFMTVHNWGENPHGTWSLRISYKSSSGYVRVSGANLTLYGSWQIPESVRAIPVQCHEACARGCWGEGSTGCDVCANLRLDTTLECVDECPPGSVAYRSYCLSGDSSSSEESAATDATTLGEEGEEEAEEEGDEEADTELNIPILLSMIVAAMILVVLLIVLSLLILIARQRYRSSKQTSFSRLKESITSTSV